MATKNAALRDAEANAKKAIWDQGANPNPSKIEILHSDGSTILATINLNATAFAAASGGNGQVAANGVPKTITAIATGTMTTARLVSADGTYQLTGLTVGTSGAHLIVDNTSVTSGQTFNLNSFTFTTPATVADPA